MIEELEEPYCDKFLELVEQSSGRMHGALFIMKSIAPKLKITEYKCKKCGRKRCEVTNNKEKEDTLKGTACLDSANCDGTMKATFGGSTYYPDLSSGSVAYGAGAIQIGESQFKNQSTWAHELAHCRHTPHSPAKPWGPALDSPGSPSYTLHDTAENSKLRRETDEDDGWDSRCLMSYSRKDRYPCGKCAMRLRGWAVENVRDPPGDLTDRTD